MKENKNVTASTVNYASRHGSTECWLRSKRMKRDKAGPR